MAASAGVTPSALTGCIAQLLRRFVIVSGVMLSASAAHAGPAEFCVTCSGPDAQYRCSFTDEAASVRSGLQLYCISTLAKEGKHESCAIGRANKSPCAGTLKVLALPQEAPGSTPAQTAAPTDAPAAVAPQAQVPEPSPAGPPSDDVEVKAARRDPVAVPAPAPAQKPAWSDTSGSPAAAAKAEAEVPEPAASDAAAADEKTPTPELMKPLESAGKAVGDAAKSTGSALSKAGDAVGSAAKKSWKCLTSLFGDC